VREPSLCAFGVMTVIVAATGPPVAIFLRLNPELECRDEIASVHGVAVARFDAPRPDQQPSRDGYQFPLGLIVLGTRPET